MIHSKNFKWWFIQKTYNLSKTLSVTEHSSIAMHHISTLVADLYTIPYVPENDIVYVENIETEKVLYELEHYCSICDSSLCYKLTINVSDSE